MNDPCLVCRRVKQCRSDASFAGCAAYRLYKKSARAEQDARQDPCVRCTKHCRTDRFPNCNAYVTWLQHRMARVREMLSAHDNALRQDKTLRQDKRQAYCAHLQWMEENARWKE